MRITWIGHSCFKIEEDGYRIIIDPYKDGSVPGLQPVRETAEMVICTHEHGDHSGRENVMLAEERENPFSVTVLQSYHDDALGTKRGMTNIIIVDDGKKRVVHLGDLGCDPGEDILEQIKNPDVLLMPVGGFYTIDAEQAVELAKRIKPRITVPMHYRDDEAGFGYGEIETVKHFAELMNPVIYTEKSMLDTDEEGYEGTVILVPDHV